MSEPQKNWRPVSKTLATRNVQITKSGTEGAASSRNESGPSAVEAYGRWFDSVWLRCASYVSVEQL